MFLCDNLVLVEGVELSTIPPSRNLAEQSQSIGIDRFPPEPYTPPMSKAALSDPHVTIAMM